MRSSEKIRKRVWESNRDKKEREREREREREADRVLLWSVSDSSKLTS